MLRFHTGSSKRRTNSDLESYYLHCKYSIQNWTRNRKTSLGSSSTQIRLQIQTARLSYGGNHRHHTKKRTYDRKFIKITKKMQLCGTIYCPLFALHVSSDIFIHNQELLNCIFNLLVIHTYVSACQCRRYVLPEAVKIQFIQFRSSR